MAMADKIAARCEDCVYFDYDEDELALLTRDGAKSCPYFRFYDEYKSVQKQN